MTQFNECVEKPTSKEDRLRWLLFVEWNLYIVGVCLTLTAVMTTGGRVWAPVGLIACLLAPAIGMIRERMLKHFREIDELKSKIQELEEKLAQK